MQKTTIAINETMEQVHKHFEKYLALHREIVDDGQIIARAVAERWGDTDPHMVLEQAEINSLAKSRLAMIGNPNKNPWITTNVQSDLFNTVPVRIPSVLIIDGKARNYYEVSIVDGLDWWRARHAAKTVEADAFTEAAEKRKSEANEANAESEKLENMVRVATINKLDPKTVRYARTQATEN